MFLASPRLLFSVPALAALCFLASAAIALELSGTPRSFSRFELLLPPGWDGDEQSGFISDNRDEYMINVARKALDEDRYLAQVSIYILPNTSGNNSEQAASVLAEAQADSTSPVQEGIFWVFEGEPRSNIVHGRAKTLVRALPDKMLIIIAQDDKGQDAATIISSLKALTPDARELLGVEPSKIESGKQ